MADSTQEIPDTDPVAIAVVSAIRSGNVAGVEQLLREHAGLAKARIVDGRGAARSLLHVAADWPGHFPRGPEIVRALVAAGADVNARMAHPDNPNCQETPLHWAASSDDVAVLDALLDAGADIEAAGAVFTGGPPMSDAVVFAQWRAARRLLERGARTTMSQAAALGLLERVERACASLPPPTAEEITGSFWNACRSGQRQTAEYLLARGANLNWAGWDNRTPLDVARKGGHAGLVEWLRSRGAKSNDELA